jgi:CRP-like cAMP-binding protein
MDSLNLTPGEMRAVTPVREAVCRLALFHGLSEETLEKVAKMSRIRQVPKGSMIFFQKDPADALYIVYSGSVAILMTSSDGRELVIREVREGEFFGEIALILKKSRSATAVAREKCGLMILPAALFQDILDGEPTFARNLLRMISELLYLSAERESALAFLDAPARLARILLQLDQQAVNSGSIAISQEELAQRTGLTRQTAAKFLGRWRRAGWLITGRGRIVLLNHAALQRVEQQLPG